MHTIHLYELVNNLTNKLINADFRRIKNDIDRLIEQHQEVTNDARMGFMYNGDYYRHSQSRTIERLPMLAFTLSDAMAVIVKDKKQVELDKQQIGQILGKLLKDCKNSQQVRDALPDCLVSLVPDLAKLSRSVPVETMIGNDERLLRQYHKILPVIEVYSVGHMMY